MPNKTILFIKIKERAIVILRENRINLPYIHLEVKFTKIINVVKIEKSVLNDRLFIGLIDKFYYYLSA